MSWKSRVKFRAKFGVSRKKAGKMSVNEFAKGPVANRIAKEGKKQMKKDLKKAKKNKRGLF